MALLAQKKALLIACQTLNPFVTRDLLVGTPTIEPIPGAKDIRIGDVLKELHDQDKRFGLSVIDTIRDSLKQRCDDEGYVLNMAPSVLVKHIPTIGALATRLRNATTPK